MISNPLFRFIVGTTFCSTLLWMVIPYLESNFTDFKFLIFTICVGSVSIMWRIIVNIYDSVMARTRAINEVSKNIEIMMKSGMTVEQIIKELELKVEKEGPEDLNNLQDEVLDTETEGVRTVKVQYDPLTEISGYYNGEPIYDRIKLANGRTAVFDGIHDMKQAIDPSKLKESTMILESGIIYTLEK